MRKVDIQSDCNCTGSPFLNDNFTATSGEVRTVSVIIPRVYPIAQFIRHSFETGEHRLTETAINKTDRLRGTLTLPHAIDLPP
jgi:hypothetical protein